MIIENLEEAFAKFIPNNDGADFTGRCLPSHQEGLNEMVERGTIDGREVEVYYLLTNEEAEREDFTGVDWAASVHRIEKTEE